MNGHSTSTSHGLQHRSEESSRLCFNLNTLTLLKKTRGLADESSIMTSATTSLISSASWTLNVFILSL